MVEYCTVRFVDFVHDPTDSVRENGMYLYMVEMVIDKGKKIVLTCM